MDKPGPIIPSRLSGVAYADYWDKQVPYGYKNDPRKGIAAIGEEILKASSDSLSKVIRQIKELPRSA